MAAIGSELSAKLGDPDGYVWYIPVSIVVRVRFQCVKGELTMIGYVGLDDRHHGLLLVAVSTLRL